ncbi:hypothetical protein Bint_0353 [Brachyspira intermedia PWS/A]|uniref:Uncharacterized protein n=1 Tax=Brachyspira intermedia (strain ATCC 51140 / PWS/A) TaxID=1045858 RepID=G0EIH9_BRAIP|nr:glycosyltransferase family 9 protein [Brachyspira intermedia]AEM20987.1 hypothetical protein Bint_0353 [Brachyspira intermedia PWS/A]
MRILFCQLRNHGDIIRTFPSIEAIKINNPNYFIGYTCFEEMQETCSLCKSIDIIIPQPKFSPVTDTQGGTRILDCSIFYETIEKVKKEKFDLYIDFHGVFQSAIFGMMCNIKHRLGRSKETSKDGASLFYTDIYSIKEKNINRMFRHFDLCQKIFPNIKPIINNYAQNNNNIISIFPGSSKMGILKRLNINKYLELANLLSKKSEVQFVLGKEDDDLIEVVKKSGFNFIITNYLEIILDKIINSKIVIGNDCAYTHLAIWKNIPTIMICGPTSEVINGVWKFGKGKTIKIESDCICSDIWNNKCHNNHKCMENITIDYILDSIEEFI